MSNIPGNTIDHAAINLGLSLSTVDHDPDTIAVSLRARFTNPDGTVDESLLARHSNQLLAVTYFWWGQRTTHEQAHTAVIGLDHRYNSLKGKPEHFGKYIHAFGGLALQHFIKAQDSGVLDRVTAELAGTIQYGVYGDSTKALDKAVEAIPDQITEVDPKAAIKIYSKEDMDRRYRFFPTGRPDGSKAWPFDYGIIRRRRRVADIALQGCAEVGLFKQSYGLVITKELSAQERAELNSLYQNADSSKFKELQANDSKAAAVVVASFERAIKEPENTTRHILPIGANYIMTAQRTA